MASKTDYVSIWLSRDPLDEDWDATLYSYIINDPVDGIDPFGLKVQSRG